MGMNKTLDTKKQASVGYLQVSFHLANVWGSMCSGCRCFVEFCRIKVRFILMTYQKLSATSEMNQCGALGKVLESGQCVSHGHKLNIYFVF